MTPMKRKARIAIFAVGEKGRAFIAAMLEDDRSVVTSVHSYNQSGTLDNSLASIQELCEAHAVPVTLGARTRCDVNTDAELVFVVGWQYLLPPDPRIVVFHDSLLPRYRGFAPTVSALIIGESEIGVTALRPVDEPDAGPILAQHSLSVTYPATIRSVLNRLAGAYIQCARDVVDAFVTGTLAEVQQDPARATYSIWRGQDDYLIDWNDDAARICRTVDALGWPYSGARTMLDSKPLTVVKAIPGPDLRFEITQPGKIWSLTKGIPTVVCGRGTAVLLEVRDDEDELFHFDRLRSRLG